MHRWSGWIQHHSKGLDSALTMLGPAFPAGNVRSFRDRWRVQRRRGPISTSITFILLPGPLDTPSLLLVLNRLQPCAVSRSRGSIRGGRMGPDDSIPMVQAPCFLQGRSSVRNPLLIIVIGVGFWTPPVLITALVPCDSRDSDVTRPLTPKGNRPRDRAYRGNRYPVESGPKHFCGAFRQSIFAFGPAAYSLELGIFPSGHDGRAPLGAASSIWPLERPTRNFRGDSEWSKPPQNIVNRRLGLGSACIVPPFSTQTPGACA